MKKNKIIMSLVLFMFLVILTGCGKDSPKRIKLEIPESEKYIEVAVIDKRNEPGEDDSDDWVGFTLEITNKTDKTIEEIQGILDIQDLSGDTILQLNYNLANETIEPGETIVFDSLGMHIQEYISKKKNELFGEQKKIYHLSHSDLKYNYQVVKISYEDGSSIGIR